MVLYALIFLLSSFMLWTNFSAELISEVFWTIEAFFGKRRACRCMIGPKGCDDGDYNKGKA